MYPSISLVNARALRDEFRAKISLGANPKSNPHKEIRDTTSFEQVFNDWYEVWLLYFCLMSLMDGGLATGLVKDESGGPQ